MLETKEHIAQFLVLQDKNPEELRSICEGLKLSTNGTKANMLDRLIQLEDTKPQHDILIPQAIALRTRSPEGSIQKAIETMKKWRKILFDDGVFKDFNLINGKGEVYTTKLKYIRCSSETLVKVIKDGWIFPQPMQSDLLETIIKNPKLYQASIVQKPSSNGGNFIMLHVHPIKEV